MRLQRSPAVRLVTQCPKILTMKFEIPQTMRAVQGIDYGDIDTVLSVCDGVPVPRLTDLSEKTRKDFMLIRTRSVALAPGDCRVLSGKTRELQGPPSMPYVPGGDVSGIVVELPGNAPKDLPFVVGDRVAARFLVGPRGALGEYALVSTKVAEKIPVGLSWDEAAALAGASPAILVVDRIQPGERVLVMGARGGLGSHVSQLLRARGASFVAGVTSAPETLSQKPFSFDDVIDYTKQEVFTMKKYQERKFDCILDFAGYGYRHVETNSSHRQPLIVKTGSEGGRFLTTVPPIGPIFEGHSFWEVTKIFLFPVLWKAFSSRVWKRRRLPKYTFAMSLPDTRECISRTMEYAKAGKLQAVIDPTGPFPFTTEGVRSAFHLQESRHSHGKVVIRVAVDDI